MEARFRCKIRNIQIRTSTLARLVYSEKIRTSTFVVARLTRHAPRSAREHAYRKKRREPRRTGNAIAVLSSSAGRPARSRNRKEIDKRTAASPFVFVATIYRTSRVLYEPNDHLFARARVTVLGSYLKSILLRRAGRKVGFARPFAPLIYQHRDRLITPADETGYSRLKDLRRTFPVYRITSTITLVHYSSASRATFV